jgi:hypothetical protein
MSAIRKNKLVALRSGSNPLESRTMLAASSFSFTFGKNATKKVKKAAQAAKDFWGKIINTNKNLNIHIDMKPLTGRRAGEFRAGQFVRSGKDTVIISNTKEFKEFIRENKDKDILTETVIHEVGHALGLGHENGTIMTGTSEFGNRNVSQRQIQRLTKLGLIQGQGQKKNSN